MVPEDPTGGRLVAWAAGLHAAHQLGSALCETSFVPKEFRSKPAEAAAAILYGDEIGLTPTQSLQSVYVISGKPALYARAMVAVVLAAGHEVWTVRKSDTEVIVAGRRRGSAHVIEEKWTTARAQKAGYATNKKYGSDPQAMLYARAAADVCRQVAPDALAGIAYSVEEMELAEVETTAVTRTPAKKSTARRAVEPAPAPPEPDFEPVPTVSGPVEPADGTRNADAAPGPESDGMVTRSQLAKMAAQMRDLGLTDRDAALAFVAETIGREVKSRNELTTVEASRLIEQMAYDLGELPEPEES